jgi:molybdopterin-binding protein
VSRIDRGAGEHVVVHLTVGGATLAAEVTTDAVERLAVAVGKPMYALVKSVAVDVGR